MMNTDLDKDDQMPTLFVGHGNPMNAIEDNEFSRAWREAAQKIPKPKVILCISAHWETWGTAVTVMDKPRTIHDFGGFPRELYEVEYSASGSPQFALITQKLLTNAAVGLDRDWGLDHGCWSVLRQMYPKADIPVIQLSLDYTKPASEHYTLAKDLAGLRKKGVLIIGSGNMVHNLRRIVLKDNDFSRFNEPYGLDWAIEANDLFKKLILENKHRTLIDYSSLGRAVELAVPTPEHYLPMLYPLAIKEDDEIVTFFNDQPLAGSLTMTSFIVDKVAH